MDWAELARRQAGVISRAQLLRCGVSSGRIDRLISRGELVTLAPAIFVHRSIPIGRGQQLWAAVLRTDGVVSHGSAAWLWKIEMPSRMWGEIADAHAGRISAVTVPDVRFRNRTPGVRVHRTPLVQDEMVVLRGLPATSMRRTVIDVLRELPLPAATTFFDRMVQQRVTSAADLVDEIQATPRRPGNVQLRRLVADAEPGAHAESERVMHRLLRSAAIPGWKPQLPVEIKGRVYELDIGFEDAMVGIEIKGRRFHGRESDRWDDDHDRLLEVRDAGWDIVEVTWRQLTERPDRVVAAIRAALLRALRG